MVKTQPTKNTPAMMAQPFMNLTYIPTESPEAGNMLEGGVRTTINPAPSVPTLVGGILDFFSATWA